MQSTGHADTQAASLQQCWRMTYVMCAPLFRSRGCDGADSDGDVAHQRLPRIRVVEIGRAEQAGHAAADFPDAGIVLRRPAEAEHDRDGPVAQFVVDVRDRADDAMWGFEPD